MIRKIRIVFGYLWRQPDVYAICFDERSDMNWELDELASLIKSVMHGYNMNTVCANVYNPDLKTERVW